MTSIAQRTQKPKGGGLLTALLEAGFSFGGYYLLRAFGVGIFWSLTIPGIAVLLVASAATVRRRRIDMFGFLVLVELVATIGFTLATQNARVAAVREPIYVLIGGVFCLATLLYRTPFTHVSTSSMATFGDPKREKAFEQAWREVPRYRLWQRVLTGAFGVIMVVTSVLRMYLLAGAPDDGLSHAIDVSNVISLVMIGALVVVSAVLIQPPRKIIERLLAQM